MLSRWPARLALTLPHRRPSRLTTPPARHPLALNRAAGRSLARPSNFLPVVLWKLDPGVCIVARTPDPSPIL